MLTRLLTFAAVGIAANAYLKRRRSTGPSAGPTPLLTQQPSANGSPSDGSVDPSTATFAAMSADGASSTTADSSTSPGATASSASTPPPSSTATGTDSPNAAERLQAEGLARTPADGRAGDLSPSTSQTDPDDPTPGLPDFARGA